MTDEQLDILCLSTALPFAPGLLDWQGHRAAEVETHDNLLVIVAFSNPPRVMIHDSSLDDGSTNIRTESRTVEGIAEAITDGLTCARIARVSQ